MLRRPDARDASNSAKRENLTLVRLQSMQGLQPLLETVLVERIPPGENLGNDWSAGDQHHFRSACELRKQSSMLDAPLEAQRRRKDVAHDSGRMPGAII